ncbi:MAG TPA: glycosyltransferase family 2 protein, partial [Stenomitos sp.]
MTIFQGMLGIVDVGLWGLGLLLLCEVWAAQAFPDDKPVPSDSAARPRLAVLVPAHNEALHIKATVQSLLLQLNPCDRLIVIADNCEDDTAQLAAQAGALVLERISPQRGKGYALDYGLKSLAADPPDVVMIIDADCEVAPGSLEALALRAGHTQRPVQATYLMTHSGVPTLRDRISEFALTLKNLVRPLGMHRLGWPCLLTGSGMAFPWSLLQSVSLAGNKTVDDMQLTIDLALQGKAPCYEPRACLTGRLMQFNAASSQ